MENLLKAQINAICKLALPDGLQDLMSDISREVLRAQPQNMYQFIADYLEALLEARETLTIACKICNDICNCVCDPHLTSELKQIGLDGKDVDTVVTMITECLENDQVKEQNLLLKLIKKTSIDESQLVAVQHAIQCAFKRHRLSDRSILNDQNEIHLNKDTSEAVRHTFNVYKQEKLTTENGSEEIFVAPEFKPCVATVSSSTLAGSYIHLPIFRPYSAHVSEILSAVPETEHASIDYTVPSTTAAIREENFKSRETGIICEEIDENQKSCVFFNEDKDYIDTDNNSSPEDVIDEIIENIESENESTASSIVESLNDFDNECQNI